MRLGLRGEAEVEGWVDPTQAEIDRLEARVTELKAML